MLSIATPSASPYGVTRSSYASLRPSCDQAGARASVAIECKPVPSALIRYTLQDTQFVWQVGGKVAFCTSKASRLESGDHAIDVAPASFHATTSSSNGLVVSRVAGPPAAGIT